MDTQTAFGLGMLVVVAIGMLIAIVIGMLKLSHLEAELEDTRAGIKRTLEHIERQLAEVHREFDHRLSKEAGYIESTVADFNRTLHNRIDNVQSIVDSRFDKFENKISKKQILKD